MVAWTILIAQVVAAMLFFVAGTVKAFNFSIVKFKRTYYQAGFNLCEASLLDSQEQIFFFHSKHSMGNIWRGSPKVYQGGKYVEEHVDPLENNRTFHEYQSLAAD